MRSQFFVPFTAAALVTFVFAANLHAIPPAIVTATLQHDGTTEYSIANNTGVTALPFYPFDQPFDIALLLVEANGSILPMPGWYTETVDAAAWDRNMRSDTGQVFNLSWQAYTGLSWLAAFPDNPNVVSGYFSPYYIVQIGVDRQYFSYFGPELRPDGVLGGFDVQGPPGSTFLVAGPIDTLFGQEFEVFPYEVGNYSAPTTVVPEPASVVGLATLAVCSLTGRRKPPLAGVLHSK